MTRVAFLGLGSMGRPMAARLLAAGHDLSVWNRTAGRDVNRPVAPFPWKQVISIGLGTLRLSPDQFWRMTPRELALAIEAVTGRSGEPFARHALADLMKRYPDDR